MPAPRNNSVKDYIDTVAPADMALNYHVISVFGSQSTGKSTLLNALFHTRFDVMNESQRQQTTKGIWLGYSPKIECNGETTARENVFVMDVEGSDGRERGEDQDFERKAALFALSTSEVLIVNIWEHQVGLYQGANMGLLKTVFEVNLSLFGDKEHKMLLLFVIRDHVGSTPLSNLSTTLTEDLNKMWNDIAKPATVDPEVSLSKYFDLDFVGLSHKVLQPEKFESDVRSLGDRFSTSTPGHLFKQDYRQSFPIDGWAMYAHNCWDQIMANKDLDLPTQQILVARFRCDEIVKESMELFATKFDELFATVDLSTLSGAALARNFHTLHELTVANYDSQAGHYNKLVYESKREALTHDINNKLNALLQSFLKELKKSIIIQFNESLNDKSNKVSFLEKSSTAKESALNKFTEELASLDSEIFPTGEDANELTTLLDDEIDKARKQEIQSLVSRLVKKFIPSLKRSTLDSFAAPDLEMWDRILDNFRLLLSNSLSKFQLDGDTYDFRLGCSSEDNEEIATKIKTNAWIAFDQFIHEYLNIENIITILRRQFEDVFTYDSQGIPRVWKTELEISKVYKEASEHALKSLPLLAIAKLSTDCEIIPDMPLGDGDDDDDEEDEPHRFAHILSSTQQLQVKKGFLKQAEVAYRDAMRSIVSNIAKIPPFMYVLLIVLGWNEFMAILRNPLYLVLTILICTGLFFVHTLNLWGPLEMAFQAIFKQLKDHLASLLLDDRPPPPMESYEMEDLTGKKEN